MKIRIDFQPPSRAATTCNDTSHSFAYAAGDYISMQVVASATATNNATINFGVEFDNP